MNDKRPNEETLLEEALALESDEARQTFLRGACGGNQQLLARVQTLIKAHHAAGGFLKDDPSPAPGATIQLDIPPEEPTGTIIGRYKLLQKIGEGGMGIVYMAEQEEPVRRRAALKIIKLGMDTRQVIARFEAER